MVRNGEPIPVPGTLDQVSADHAVVEASRLPVRADLPRRAMRVNITLSEYLPRTANGYPKRERYTRFGQPIQAMREQMRQAQA